MPEPASASPYQTSCLKPFKENFLNFVSKMGHFESIMVPDPTTPLKKKINRFVLCPKKVKTNHKIDV